MISKCMHISESESIFEAARFLLPTYFENLQYILCRTMSQFNPKNKEDLLKNLVDINIRAFSVSRIRSCRSGWVSAFSAR